MCDPAWCPALNSFNLLTLVWVYGLHSREACSSWGFTCVWCAFTCDAKAPRIDIFFCIATKKRSISAAILWDYFQGGGMFTKIMKTRKIERLRFYCLLSNIHHIFYMKTDRVDPIEATLGRVDSGKGAGIKIGRVDLPPYVRPS